MSSGNIAAIGDRASVLALRAVGIEVYSPASKEETEQIIQRLARLGYSIILITEHLAAQVSELIRERRAEPYPIILPILGTEGGNSLGMNSLKANVEKAIGMDIIFKDN